MNTERWQSLLSRSADSHKGTYGRTLVIAGSRGMTGAAALAASSVGRSGAGLVTLAVPDRCLEVAASFDPIYMTVPLPDDAQGRMTEAAISPLIHLADAATCVGIGPGIGKSDGVKATVGWVYSACLKPVVVDADALNCLAQQKKLPAANGLRILTPHPGEFRRLLGEDYEVQDRIQVAQNYAKQNSVILVLKGHRTIVTDGDFVFENSTGNPGMATGGSGDVLTGVLTGLVAQSPQDVLMAVTLAVHIHGLAGDLARDQHGEIAMVATDIRDHLGTAFQRLQAAN